MKVEVYKCYLVEVVDDEKGAIFSEYYFTDRKDAIRQGEKIKEKLMKERERVINECDTKKI